MKDTISDRFEQQRWKEGFVVLAFDEAGMGSLCGKTYVGGVVFPIEYDFSVLAAMGLNDSKKLTEKQRFAMVDIIQKDALWWCVDSADLEHIARRNVYHARFDKIVDNVKVFDLLGFDFALLMDGNKSIPADGNYMVENTCLVKGDSKSYSLAAASILAKTAKDTEMLCLHEQFPEYNWRQNKGYGSKEHRDAIRKHGLTPHHRPKFCQKIIEAV